MTVEVNNLVDIHSYGVNCLSETKIEMQIS